MVTTETLNASAGTHRPRLMRGYCGLDSETSAYLEQVMVELSFSARGHDRILKVARISADLEGVESIQMQHLLEAV